MKRFAPLIAAGVLLATSACQESALAAEKVIEAPVAAVKSTEGTGLKTAIFAGGCFWGVEAVFSHTKGVTSAVSGYHGGTQRQADYELVSSGVTDHVEAVKVTYDPSVVRYDELLRIYFSVIIDPTLKNRQGPDRGAHYNAELVPVSAEQRKVAAAYLAQLKKTKLWDRPILTSISPARTFYAAETYHQDFAAKNPRHGYIQRWDAPKLAALKRLHPSFYRAEFRRN